METLTHVTTRYLEEVVLVKLLEHTSFELYKLKELD